MKFNLTVEINFPSVPEEHTNNIASYQEITEPDEPGLLAAVSEAICNKIYDNGDVFKIPGYDGLHGNVASITVYDQPRIIWGATTVVDPKSAAECNKQYMHDLSESQKIAKDLRDEIAQCATKG